MSWPNPAQRQQAMRQGGRNDVFQRTALADKLNGQTSRTMRLLFSCCSECAQIESTELNFTGTGGRLLAPGFIVN